MSRDDYPYPEDEFDTLGADRSPQGVHRAPLPRWRQLLPFLIVLVLAPTLAFVAVRLISGSDGTVGGGDTPTPSATTEAPPTETPSEVTQEPTSQTQESTTDPTDPTTAPGADLDLATQIWVLNGSGVSGLAADAVAVLEEAGWQDANAEDYGSAQPTATTLFYDNADQADEAEAVGEQLGIDTLSENADAADGDIVIVLRSDFTLP